MNRLVVDLVKSVITDGSHLVFPAGGLGAGDRVQACHQHQSRVPGHGRHQTYLHRCQERRLHLQSCE